MTETNTADRRKAIEREQSALYWEAYALAANKHLTKDQIAACNAAGHINVDYDLLRRCAEDRHINARTDPPLPELDDLLREPEPVHCQCYLNEVVAMALENMPTVNQEPI